ncbi:MAG: flagellar biosynthesis protein FliC [Neptuniibacter caesariensis]|uniref:Flagellin n=1 Tax=Neptuniibacter caesariensis TaxID=207954 RepID=A0A2G6JPM1_NEPCE|nr:MAG: flagellar biosynthesis protein FliC [Neptuniibacter caesariensis]
MAMVINSNIQSLNAQRNLMITQGEQSQAMERLTSGKRINSAGDDAAGLSITNRMTSQVRGLDQAIRNANDGISLIQTAEGALDETTNILQRMRELSIQSANGTYDQSNRGTLNAEVQQLKAEMDRIADTTAFNGQKILDGSLGNVALQVGSEANETIALKIGEMNTSRLGGNNADVVGTASSDTDLSDGLAIAGASVTINNQSITQAEFAAVTNLNDLNTLFAEKVEGVEVSAYAELQATATGDGILASGESITMTTKNADGTSTSYVVSDTNSLEELASEINRVTGGNITATIAKDADGNNKLSLGASNVESLTLTETGTGAALDALGIGTGSTAQFALTLNDTNAANGGISVSYATAADADVLGIDARTSTSVTGQGAAAAATADGDIVINNVKIAATAGGTQAELVAAINDKASETGVFASTSGGELTLSAEAGKQISVELTATGAGATGLQATNSSDYFGGSVASIDISTAAGAQKAIDVIDNALEQINSTRGDLGAINNRLDFTVNNLSNVSENVAAARSRIEDADFAKESANLSRAQVLQQAGTAMLAQANAAPQQVLSLLQ